MAKMNGLVGGLSGKMGNAVFRIRKGQQIVAQYQPIVNNPKSEGQSAQRAKFKLMSQMAAIMQDAIGGTLAVLSRPERKSASPRNNFVRVNFPLATTRDVDGGVAADIPIESIQLTNSFRPLGELVTSISTVGSTTTVTASVRELPESVTIVRFVTIGLRKITDSENTVPEVLAINDVAVGGGATPETSVVVPRGVAENHAFVLSYGIIPLDNSASSESLSDIFNDDSAYASVLLSRAVRDGSVTETMTVGAEVLAV